MDPVLVGCWRDNKQVMKRALKSAARHISGVAISIDPTHREDGEFIKVACRIEGLPCHIYETPRTDGGTLRTIVMQEGEAYAKKLGASYILNLDADDHLEFASDFTWPYAGDAYHMLECIGNLSHAVKRLFRVGLDWKFHGPLHERAYCEKVPLDSAVPILRGVKYIKHIDGDREPDRYDRHAEIIKGWLKDHPGDSYYTYYLGQSLHAAGKLEEAREAYEDYLEAPDTNPTLRYRAALHVALMVAHQGALPLDILKLMYRVASVDPNRAEPYRLIETFCRQMAAACTTPEEAVMRDAGVI